jgi:hypothetical protein
MTREMNMGGLNQTRREIEEPRKQGGHISDKEEKEEKHREK